MSNAIKIHDNTDEITIVNCDTFFKVEDSFEEINISDNEDVIKIKEEVAERVIINATDVRYSIVQTIDINMNCSSSEIVGDAVYLESNNEVRKANNSSIDTAKVVGFIVSKSSSTTCKVRIAGLIDDFTDLVVGKEYYLNHIDGDIDFNPPTSNQSVICRVGKAIDTDKFLININNNYIIRSNG